MQQRWPKESDIRNKLALWAVDTYLVEHILESLLCQCRAFDILHSSKFSRKPLTLFTHDWSLFLSCQLFYHLNIVSQVDLCAYDEAGHSGTVMMYFGEPLFLDVLERRG